MRWQCFPTLCCFTFQVPFYVFVLFGWVYGFANLNKNYLPTHTFIYYCFQKFSNMHSFKAVGRLREERNNITFNSIAHFPLPMPALYGSGFQRACTTDRSPL